MKIDHTFFRPDYAGLYQTKTTADLAAVLPEGAEGELRLFDPSGAEVKTIPLPVKERNGLLCGVHLEGRDLEGLGYAFCANGKECPDPYARSVKGERTFLPFLFAPPAPLSAKPALSDRLIYKLHVRGFSMLADLPKKKRGSFPGLSELLSHITDLGFNTVELMPVYTFDPKLPETETARAERRNYWGYADRNFYFAPNAAYAAGDDPCREFRDLVQSMHERSLSVVLEFFFPNGSDPFLVLSVLRYWKRAYAVDGFHLIGEGVDRDLVSADPALSDSLLLFEQLPEGDIRERAAYNDGFLVTARGFLKGDQGLTGAMSEVFRQSADTCPRVNYVANVNGFTLYDAVSYDYRHNEENGENNTDGPERNLSWNCGEEGPSRKRTVRDLRRKQVENAMSFVFLSKGLPLLYAGDEFGNTQNGNNNGYLLDDPNGWMRWKSDPSMRDVEGFLRSLLAFRAEHPILHRAGSYKGTDTKAYGLPDLSVHAERAFYHPYDAESRGIAFLINERYADPGGDSLLYFVFHAYWEKTRYALPAPPKGMQWYLCMCTDQKAGEEFLSPMRPLRRPSYYEAPPRSVSILIAGP